MKLTWLPSCISIQVEAIIVELSMMNGLLTATGSHFSTVDVEARALTPCNSQLHALFIFVIAYIYV